MSLRLHHVVTASTSMSLRPDHAFAMTMMRRQQARPVRTTFLLRTTCSDDDAVTFAPREGHALTTCGIKYGCYSGHPTSYGEATQLYVTFLVQGQVQLLDCQAVIMLRMIRRKSRRKHLAGCVRGLRQKDDFSMVTMIASCVSCAWKIIFVQLPEDSSGDVR